MRPSPGPLERNEKRARWIDFSTLFLDCSATTAEDIEEAQRQARLRRRRRLHRSWPSARPLRLDKGRDESEVNMTSMSDSGGVETVMSTSGQVRNESDSSPSPTVSQSLRAWRCCRNRSASGTGASPSVAGPTCPGCGGVAGALQTSTARIAVLTCKTKA